MFFGPGLLIQIVLGVATALLAEAAALRLRGKPLPPFLLDGSAIITAVLLALCLPPLAPWWLIVSGTAFAILLAKHCTAGSAPIRSIPRWWVTRCCSCRFPAQLTHWLPPDVGGLSAASLSFAETLHHYLHRHTARRISPGTR